VSITKERNKTNVFKETFDNAMSRVQY